MIYGKNKESLIQKYLSMNLGRDQSHNYPSNPLRFNQRHISSNKTDLEM